MNRQLYKLQHTQRECNYWWLTWSRDQELKRKQENRQLLLDIGISLALVAFGALIYFYAGAV